MKSTERFSDRAQDYRLYRPGYPTDVTDLMRKECGLPSGARVTDIGAGTGIFTRRLVEAGYHVTAVEPNAAMRRVIEEELGEIEIASGTAEETGLPNQAFDALTSAQAFHWFDAKKTAQEFRRILKPEGWLFLIWNQWEDLSSPFNDAYLELMKGLREEHQKVRERALKTEAALDCFFAAGTFRTRTFSNPQGLDWPALRGRFLSTSYVPLENDSRHNQLVEQLRSLFDAHSVQGKVTLEQETEVFYGKLDRNVS